MTLTDEHQLLQRAASTGNVQVDTHTGYSYLLSTAVAKECLDCVSDMYWGNINDGDYLDYYNAKFMGFAQATVNQPDGGQDIHKYNATMGYGIYDTTQVGCFTALPPIGPCSNAPWWDIRNAGHGRETEVDVYDAPPNATHLLRQTTTQYLLTCPAPNVSATPPYTGTWGNDDLRLR